MVIKIKNSLIFKKFKLSKDFFSFFCWTGAIFCYYFQFPFKNLSSLIVPFTILLLALNITLKDMLWSKKFFSFFLFFCFYLLIPLLLGIFNHNSFSNIMRFLFILIGILLFTSIRIPKFEKYEKILVILSVCKSLILISLAIYLLVKQDYWSLRVWARENSLGDIYFFRTFIIIPKVQVIGNALLVCTFISSYFKQRKFTVSNLIILIGIFFAGNFAYLLGIGCFFLYIFYLKNKEYLRKNKHTILVLWVLFLVFLTFSIPYVRYNINLKSESSNTVRINQAELLLDTNFFIGNGLANEINAAIDSRTYSGDIYYELQTLYIYNQIGFIGISLFYFILFYRFSKLEKYRSILYVIYLIYSFWNPYSFDTTQMFATVLFINMKVTF